MFPVKPRVDERRRSERQQLLSAVAASREDMLLLSTMARLTSSVEVSEVRGQGSAEGQTLLLFPSKLQKKKQLTVNSAHPSRAFEQ